MLFVIHASDKPDSAELRQATRPDHLAYMSDFDILVGGPMLDEHSESCGSIIIVEMEDLAATEAFAANDPYRKVGLFDTVLIRAMKKVIWPGE